MTSEQFVKRVLGDARYSERHAFPKWNIRPTVLQEPRLFPRVFPELTREDHIRRADAFEARAQKISTQHHRALERGRKAFGTHGALISGGFREHWPEANKQTVRRLAHASTLLADASRAHRDAVVVLLRQRQHAAEERGQPWNAPRRDFSRRVKRVRTARRDPGGPGKYIVKISNSPRYKGEYSGGATLAEGITQARTFKADVGPRARIEVGYFTFGKSDPEEGRFHLSRTVQQGETSWL